MKRDNSKTAIYSYEFNSINDFYSYVCDTPLNEVFRWGELSSNTGSSHFTQTSCFQEAVDLMKNGWDSMSEKLNKQLTSRKFEIAPTEVRKLVNSVAGFQPIVPLYLSGVPTNMVSVQKKVVKQKVITMTKLLNYNCMVRTNTIIEESVKAMQLVKKIESQGYRVNLNIALGTAEDGRNILAKVRVKNANEKLNVSKLAFPMVHPSMLRRLFFRFIETCPDTTSGYKYGYGRPVEYDKMKKAYPDEIVIPAIWNMDVKDVRTLDDIH